MLFVVAFFFHELINTASQRTTETSQMSASIALGNIIGKAENTFLVRVIPLQCRFNLNLITTFLHVYNRWVNSGLFQVEMADKGPYTAIIMEMISFTAALVCELNTDPRVKKR